MSQAHPTSSDIDSGQDSSYQLRQPNGIHLGMTNNGNPVSSGGSGHGFQQVRVLRTLHSRPTNPLFVCKYRKTPTFQPIMQSPDVLHNTTPHNEAPNAQIVPSMNGTIGHASTTIPVTQLGVSSPSAHVTAIAGDICSQEFISAKGRKCIFVTTPFDSLRPHRAVRIYSFRTAEVHFSPSDLT
jgi:hypothetical protein